MVQLVSERNHLRSSAYKNKVSKIITTFHFNILDLSQGGIVIKKVIQ